MTATPSIWKRAESLFVEAATAAIDKAGLHAGPDRRRRHRLDHRHRDPQPRSARRAAARLARRRPPRAGLRPRLRRRRERPRRSRRAWPPPIPARNWLFVTVETCSISIRLDSDDPAAVVATALFGDGAAAAVVTSGEHSLARITGSAEKLWPEHAADHGLGRRGSRASRSSSTARSRRSSRQHLAEAVDEMCAKIGDRRATTSTASAAIPAG